MCKVNLGWKYCNLQLWENCLHKLSLLGPFNISLALVKFPLRWSRRAPLPPISTSSLRDVQARTALRLALAVRLGVSSGRMRQKHHFLAGEGTIGEERLVHISDVFIGWQQITVRLWSTWPRSVNILRGCENGGGKPALLVQISTACSKKSRDHSVCIPARDVTSSLMSLL